MRRKTTILLAILAFLPVRQAAYAQKFEYNVNFQYVLDNSEFDYSSDRAGQSETINMVRLTPYVGLRLGNDSTLTHRIRAGVQLQYDMGSRDYRDFVGAVPIYYEFSGKFKRGVLGAAAGVVPRLISEGNYFPAIMSDKYLIRNNNIQGILLKWRSRRLFTELCCDWVGMYGDSDHPDRRERFQILSALDWNVWGPLHLGWSGRFFHYSCCPLYDNVVDNHLINPFISYEPECWFQNLSVSLGGVFTYQRDRGSSGGAESPAGLMSQQHLRKWNVGIFNTFYWGEDLMPLYESTYNGSPEYGNGLYFGEECFHTRTGRPSIVDKLQIYYEPRITEYLKLNISIHLYLGEDTGTDPVFRGWRQHLSLLFDLDKLLQRRQSSSR